MNFFLHVCILVMIYTTLSVSVNLLAGYTGLLSVCHAAFWGIGAYATGILCANSDWPWLASVVAGMIIAGTLGVVIGWVSLRFRDDYFVMITFAFQVIVFSLMMNWTELTRGPMGVAGIRQPHLLGWHITENWEFLILSFIVAALAVFVVRRLSLAPYGNVLRAIREDETFALAMAKNVAAYKISAFVVGAVLASMAGSIFASYISYIEPSDFTIHESIFILAIMLIGGAGNPWGPVIGAVLLVSMPEILRYIGLPPAVAANVRQIIYGLLLILFMAWRPQGLIGEYTFQRDKQE